jgi:hypothetical protein
MGRVGRHALSGYYPPPKATPGERVPAHPRAYFTHLFCRCNTCRAPCLNYWLRSTLGPIHEQPAPPEQAVLSLLGGRYLSPLLSVQDRFLRLANSP